MQMPSVSEVMDDYRIACRTSVAFLCLVFTTGFVRAGMLAVDLQSQFCHQTLVSNVQESVGRGFRGCGEAFLVPATLRSQPVGADDVKFALAPAGRFDSIIAKLGETIAVKFPPGLKAHNLHLLVGGVGLNKVTDGTQGCSRVTVRYRDGKLLTRAWSAEGCFAERPQLPTRVGLAVSLVAGKTHGPIEGRFLYNVPVAGLDPKREIDGVRIETEGIRDASGSAAEFALYAITALGEAEPANAPGYTVLSGERPYEMEWAGRNEDEQSALDDFETKDGWRLETDGVEAVFEITSQRRLWGQKVARVGGLGTKPPGVIRLIPVRPLAIPAGANALSLWVHGDAMKIDNSGVDAEKAVIAVTARLQGDSGRVVTVPLGTTRYSGWAMMHRHLSAKEIADLGDASKLIALELKGYAFGKQSTLFLDGLSAFKESEQPLEFAKRAKRNLKLFEGQDAGINTGEGVLSFPTSEQTILPPNLTQNFKTSAKQEGATFVLTYTGADGTLSYEITPLTGSWSDITAKWQGAKPAQSFWRGLFGLTSKADPVVLKPCAGGGIRLAGGKDELLERPAEHLGSELKEGVVSSRWKIVADSGKATEVTYRYRIWNKSLVIDTEAVGGSVGEVRFGAAEVSAFRELIKTPYYQFKHSSPHRPASVMFGQKQVLFVAGNADWYRSNASELFALNDAQGDGVTYNGGVRYLAKTDGCRNDCFERFFVTVSPNYIETLPSIPNPKSPYISEVSSRLWRSYASSNDRESDKARFHIAYRMGLRQVIVTDHETLFRDEQESYTFRTRTAPRKGGDEGARDYSQYLRETLGYRYGPYNTFSDIAPVNEYFKLDRMARTSGWQLKSGWPRCYHPKPLFMVEACEKIPPVLHEKFGYNTAYCDVHTAIPPWEVVDFDQRVPGAGTFAQTFYAVGEIMLLQKQAWHGPVFSEGNYHAFFSGLTDGNYAQDKGYMLSKNPWLVDFDLHRIHPLEANIGMGCGYMFFWGVDYDWKKDAAQKSASLDRLIAATLAYGHSPIWAATIGSGPDDGVRPYFMALPLSSRYGGVKPRRIAYYDGKQEWLETNGALAAGAYKRSQIAVSYEGGVHVTANGHPGERLAGEWNGRRVDLPPNGYCGWTDDGKVFVLHADQAGQPFDYAVAPDHIYVDGRGSFARLKKAAGNTAGVLRIEGPKLFEYVPIGNVLCRVGPDGKVVPAPDLQRPGECGFAVTIRKAIALDFDCRELGPAEVRTARGLSYVQPVAGAFSYRIEGELTAPRTALTSASSRVLAGKVVKIRAPGDRKVDFLIPTSSKPGQRIWHQIGGQWIDFTVVTSPEESVTNAASK